MRRVVIQCPFSYSVFRVPRLVSMLSVSTTLSRLPRPRAAPCYPQSLGRRAMGAIGRGAKIMTNQRGSALGKSPGALLPRVHLRWSALASGIDSTSSLSFVSLPLSSTERIARPSSCHASRRRWWIRCSAGRQQGEVRQQPTRVKIQRFGIQDYRAHYQWRETSDAPVPPEEGQPRVLPLPESAFDL